MEISIPDLSNKNIAVVSHIFSSGPAQALVEYLTEHNIAKGVVFIGHPLLPVPGVKNFSFQKHYVKGKILWSQEKKNFGPRFLIHYLDNFVTTIFWLLKDQQKWDLYIGANNVNALSGIILRLFGKVKRVVFYCVDYAPQRFDNYLVNLLYHWTDRLAVTYADGIWNLSPRMNEARKQYLGLIANTGKSKIVPMGIWLNKIKRFPFSQINKHTFVFMGHLTRNKGIQLVVRQMPVILEKIPDFQLMIIGKGEFESDLRHLVNKLSIEKSVIFTGYIADHEKMENIMSKCAGAVALYERGDIKRNFTYYADPGKIKDYLGAGLPVLLTDVPYNAREIEKAKCGWVVTDEKDIGPMIISILKDDEKLRYYRENALRYSEYYDWNVIYNKAFLR